MYVKDILKKKLSQLKQALLSFCKFHVIPLKTMQKKSVDIRIKAI